MATRLPISLVLPAHGAAATLATAIASVTRQAFVPAEIIVVDDASPDRSDAIGAAAGARLVRLAERGGAAAARNAGAAVANEPWIAFLDADEVWLDGKLAAQWVALCRWPDAALCFTDYDALDVRGRIVPSAARSKPGYALLEASERSSDAVCYERDGLVRALAQSSFITISSVVVNRALFATSGGFNAALGTVADLDLFWRLIARGPAIAVERALVGCARRAQAPSRRSAEVDGLERLWSGVIADSEQYPPAAVELVRRDPAAPLRHGGASALRAGALAEAAAFALRALASDLRVVGGHFPHDGFDGRSARADERENVPFGRQE